MATRSMPRAGASQIAAPFTSVVLTIHGPDHLRKSAGGSGRRRTYPGRMLSRREAAVRLDIPLEMATRHGIPSRLSEAELDAIEQDPPAWLVQSRANRTGTKKVWTRLECVVCGFEEEARPKKWWPEWDYLMCDYHAPYQAPEPTAGLTRREVEGIGSRFIALVDEKR